MAKRRPKSWMARNWGVLVLTAALGINACESPYIHLFESDEERSERHVREIYEDLRCRTYKEKFGPGLYRITVESGRRHGRKIVIDCR